MFTLSPPSPKWFQGIETLNYFVHILSMDENPENYLMACHVWEPPTSRKKKHSIKNLQFPANSQPPN
jgi:hypothetical protein